MCVALLVLYCWCINAITESVSSLLLMIVYILCNSLKGVDRCMIQGLCTEVFLLHSSKLKVFVHIDTITDAEI